MTSASTAAEIRDLRVLFPASVVADFGAVLVLSRPGWPVQPVPEIGDGLGDEVIEQVVDLVADQRDPLLGGGLLVSFGRGEHGEEGVGEHGQDGPALPEALGGALTL